MSINYGLAQIKDKEWTPPSGVDVSVPAAIRDCSARVSEDDVLKRDRCPNYWYPTQLWSRQTLDRAAGRTQPKVTLPFLMEMLPFPYAGQVLFKDWTVKSSSPCNTEWDGNVVPFKCLANEISLGGTDVYCLACLVVESGRKRANNGEYAVAAMPVTPTSRTPYGNHDKIFKACEVGTWNTCRTLGSCNYPVQWVSPLGSGSAYQSVIEWMAALRAEGSDLNFNTKLGSLLGGCYPCTKAAGLSHFGEIPKAVQSGHTRNKVLPFWCPGGASPPKDCPDNMVALVDDNGLAGGPCVCEDGYTEVTDASGKSCVPCPPGYSCTARKGKQPCPPDTYSKGGTDATVCTPCNDNQCADPSTARSKCVGEANTADALCVNCGLCRSLGCGGSSCVYCQSVFV